MHWNTLTPEQQVKLDCLANGLQLSEDAKKNLTRAGNPLSLFEYPTTAGITLILDKAGYVNAPFHGIFARRARVVLDYEEETGFLLRHKESSWPVKVLSLPGYWNDKDSEGVSYRNLVMSHADRARISPISGCGFSCRFCDLNLREYRKATLSNLLEALDIALADTLLPAHHILISGGTPRLSDRAWLDTVYETIIDSAPVPVDVMLAPRPEDGSLVQRLVNWGVDGLSINLELFDDTAREIFAPQKGKIDKKTFSRDIEQMVSLSGGNGRIRSLLLVGLEPLEQTLAGVQWLAERGCDPVLSPFRPAAGTPLEKWAVPSEDDLYRCWNEAREIAEKHKVKIGPRCVPCQHNALAFPDDSGAYFCYAERGE